MITTSLLLATPGLLVGTIVLSFRTKAGATTQSLSPGPAGWLSSDLEKRAFAQLEQRFPPPDFIISAHMLLMDVIGRDRLDVLTPSDREFCWKAHCDFVVVDRASMNIIHAVEVNGHFHDVLRQQKRDHRKKTILRQFGISLTVIEPKSISLP